jgi:hypothetical protein
MNKQRIILLIVFISSIVLLALSKGSFSIGMGAETKNGVYTLVLSCPPFALLPFTILLILFIYAARTNIQDNLRTVVPSLKRRFLALLIDFIVNLLIVVIPATIIALVLNWYQTNEFSWIVSRPYNSSTDRGYFIVYAIQCFGLFVLFGLPVCQRKQSVGGIVTNTFIESKTDISLIKATFRSIAGFFTLACSVISIPLAWLSEDKRMWHDSLFNTFPKQVTGKDS